MLDNVVLLGDEVVVLAAGARQQRRSQIQRPQNENRARHVDKIEQALVETLRGLDEHRIAVAGLQHPQATPQVHCTDESNRKHDVQEHPVAQAETRFLKVLSEVRRANLQRAVLLHVAVKVQASVDPLVHVAAVAHLDPVLAADYTVLFDESYGRYAVVIVECIR